MAPATQPVGREKEDAFREHEKLGTGLYIRGPRDHCLESRGENSRPNIPQPLEHGRELGPGADRLKPGKADLRRQKSLRGLGGHDSGERKRAKVRVRGGEVILILMRQVATCRRRRRAWTWSKRVLTSTSLTRTARGARLSVLSTVTTRAFGSVAVTWAATR